MAPNLRATLLVLASCSGVASAGQHSQLGDRSAHLRADRQAQLPVPENVTEQQVNLMVSSAMRVKLDAWLTKVLQDADTRDAKACAEETSAMMKELRYAYTRRQVPDVLKDECRHFMYYERFGSNQEVCFAIVDNLVNTWRGDQDYEMWCTDVFGRRHDFKSGEDVPVKEDPGPRKGKYADVKEFSFPDDADPEHPCHGATPCPSHAGEADDEIYDKGEKKMKLSTTDGNSNLEWTPRRPLPEPGHRSGAVVARYSMGALMFGLAAFSA